MKRLLVFMLIHLVFGYGNCQSYGGQVSHQQILNEAYLDYIQKGYNPDSWNRNQSKYVEEFKKQKFVFDGSGHSRKIIYQSGTMLSGTGDLIGTYSNGNVFNWRNEPVGHKRGYNFYSGGGAVGWVQGNQIGYGKNSIYTVSENYIYSQGQRVAYIQGDDVRNLQNHLIVRIKDLNMQSLAAYLLLLAK